MILYSLFAVVTLWALGWPDVEIADALGEFDRCPCIAFLWMAFLIAAAAFWPLTWLGLWITVRYEERQLR